MTVRAAPRAGAPAREKSFQFVTVGWPVRPAPSAGPPVALCTTAGVSSVPRRAHGLLNVGRKPRTGSGRTCFHSRDPGPACRRFRSPLKTLQNSVEAAWDADARHAARKAREIALLQRCLREPLALAPPQDVAAILAQKLHIAAVLRAERSLESWAITETARPAVREWQCGAFRLRFGYQRADLEVRGPPIYPALEADRPGFAEETLYTASGMSAIAALLTALLEVRPSLAVLAARGGYGETRELLERLAPRVRVAFLHRAREAGAVEAGARILWLDSAVPAGTDATLRRAPHRCDLVVVDTTCLGRRSARIRRVLRWARERDVPLALVRSHAKLDSVGIEYGRMGSVVLAWRRRGGHAWMRDLVRETRKSVRLLGCAAVPAHFPPFCGDGEYAALCAARTASIMCATRRLARRFEASVLRGSVTRFAHGLYLTLAPRGELRVRDVKRAVDHLCEALASTGLPVRHAGSFGFDFVAVEWFADPISRGNVIRIAPGDLPASVVDAVGDGVVRWFEAQRAGMAPPRRGPAVERGRAAIAEPVLGASRTAQ